MNADDDPVWPQDGVDRSDHTLIYSADWVWTPDDGAVLIREEAAYPPEEAS